MYFLKHRCPHCGRRLVGISVPNLWLWECADCCKDKSDPIHCERGCKVELAFPDRGMEKEKESVRRYLTKGAVYEVEHVRVDSFSSNIELKKFPGIRFSSAFFRRVQ